MVGGDPSLPSLGLFDRFSMLEDSAKIYVCRERERETVNVKERAK